MPPVCSKPSWAKNIVENRNNIKHTIRRKLRDKLGTLTPGQEMENDQLVNNRALDDTILDVSDVDIDKILRDLKRLPDSIHSKPETTGAEKATISQKKPATATTQQQTLPLIKVVVPLTMAEKNGDTSKNNLSGSSIASGPAAALTIREAPEPKQKSSNETDTAASDEVGGQG